MAFADGLVGQFFGVDHGEVADAPVLEFLAHFTSQVTHGGFIDVCDLQHLRAQTVAGAHGGDFRNLQIPAHFGDRNLRRHVVNGVDDVVSVKIFDKFFIAGAEVNGIGLRVAIRVHAVGSLHHDFRLISSDGGAVGHQLAIQVCDVHFIFVDENEMAHAGSGQRFGCIGAHAADAKDSHGLGGQEINAALSDDAGSACVNRIHHMPPGMISIQYPSGSEMK